MISDFIHKFVDAHNSYLKNTNFIEKKFIKIKNVKNIESEIKMTLLLKFTGLFKLIQINK